MPMRSPTTPAVHVALYSDLGCPFAYVTAFRLRKLRAEYRGRVVIERKSLALEYVNREPTPKRTIEAEAPLVLLSEPEIPHQPWSRPDSEWPVTLWPAFEAVKCAEHQGMELAEELDWLIRRAFFADSRCVSMRHVLLDLAEQAGLGMARFVEEFDAGVHKRRVLDEARAGWDELRVPGSPTIVLASGRQISSLGLPELHLDADQNLRLVGLQPAPCSGEQCLDVLRGVLADAVAEAQSPGRTRSGA